MVQVLRSSSTGTWSACFTWGFILILLIFHINDYHVFLLPLLLLLAVSALCARRDLCESAIVVSLV